MKKNNIISIFFICAAIFGFIFGNGQKKIGKRNPSSVHTVSLNSYDDLVCPSEVEYRNIADELKLDVPKDIVVCNDPIHGKLAKFLFMAKSLQFSFSPNWAPELQDDLKNPINYIAKMANKIGFDFSEKTAIAYNKRSTREVYLGGIFFIQDPLNALSVLVHEARHSSENDPGHVTCRLGDIPKTSGGCDEFFSINNENAGAYAYSAAFYAALGLYVGNLTKADREYVLSSAMGYIGTRFNQLPAELAQAYDIVSILDKNGNVYLLNPFSYEPIPMSLPFLRNDERIERIENNISNNGLLFFTSKNSLYTWDPNKGFSLLYKDLISDSMPIYDGARIRIPFDDYPYYNFLTADNKMYYVDFDAEQMKKVLKEYQIQINHEFPNPFIPKISRFFMALFGESFFQDKEGIFYRGARYADEVPFDRRSDLNLAGKAWVQGMGGVLFETLYGIANDGKLYRASIKVVEENEQTGEPDVKYIFSEASFQTALEKKAKKYIEGLNIRALLDERGGVSFESYDQKIHSFWNTDAFEVKDIAVFRKYQVTNNLFPDVMNKEKFIKQCQIRNSINDPWIGGGIGLDSRGFLIVGAAGAQTCLRVGNKKYRSLQINHFAMEQEKISDSDFNASLNTLSNPFVQSALELVDEQGKREFIRPYEYIQK